jgi:hypothetical protein
VCTYLLIIFLISKAVTSGNQGFEAIGDWLKSYEYELKQLFRVDSLP